MKRGIITVLFAILLAALCLTCFVACKPEVVDKAPDVCYAEIQDNLKKVGERYNSCNGYSYEVQGTFGNNTSRAQVRETRSPVYFESWDYLSDDWLFTPKNDLQALVREENGQVVAYVNDEYNYYKRTVLGNPDDYERPPKIFPTVYVWDEVTLDLDKCDITYKNGIYTIVSNYDDFELGDFKSLLEFMLEDNEKEVLSNAVVTLKITADENKTTVSFATALKVDTDGKVDEREVEITWTIDFAEFDPLAFDNGEYVVLPPTDIDGVYALTDISKPLQCGRHDSVFRVELEKGVYYFEYDEAPYVTIRSVDDINNVLARGLICEKLTNSDIDYKYCYNVENDGQYYIIFEYCDYDIYQMVRCAYDDLYDADNPKTLQQNVAGTIEGKYDFEYYTYKTEGEGLLSITNTSNTAIDIICKIPSYFPYDVITVPAGEALNNIPVVNGEATLFVGKTDATQPVKYSLTTSFYQSNNGLSREFDEMPWITTEFSKEYFAIGRGLSSKHVRMHVDVKGIYSFEFENMYEGLSSDVSVYVYDVDSKQSIDYKNLALEKGDYLVSLSNSYVDLSIAKVRYVLVKTAEDYDTTITLNKISIAERNSEKTRVYPLSNIENQEIKYRFTLDEESVVLYGPYICIFDANDKPLTLGSLSLDVIKLAAGKYYFESYTLFGSYHTIAIVEDYDGPVIDYGNMQTLSLASRISFAVNELNTGYAALQIDHDGLYYVLPNEYGIYVNIYDEGLNSVPTTSYTGSFYKLNAGTYYIRVEFFTNNDITFVLKEKEQK